MLTVTHEKTSTLTVPSGGVMTDEVGAVTGDLEIVSRCDDATTACRYAGAEEWYAVTDTVQTLDGPGALGAYHDEIVARYR